MDDELLTIGEPEEEILRDVYMRLDLTRDPKVISHEFTHAMVFEVSGVLNTNFNNGAFHEGLADYFGGTINDHSRIAQTYFYIDRHLDTDADDPGVYPLSAFDSFHTKGSQLIARPLWDIRTRLEKLKLQIPILAYGSRSADTIAWGVMNRVGSQMTSFQEPLADALSKDADSFDKLFHYEILAAFAWHGIRLEPGISIIQPQEFVVDGRTGTAPPLKAIGFLGENTQYVAEFSTNPSAFGLDPLSLHQQPDPALPGFNYIKISSVDAGAPLVRVLPGDVPEGGLNHVVDFEIGNDLLELLAQGEDAAPIFMRLTTIGATGIADSHIEGAGEFLREASHPFTLYVSSTAPGQPGSCACSFAARDGGSIPGSLAMLLCCAALIARRRQAR